MPSSNSFSKEDILANLSRIIKSRVKANIHKSYVSSLLHGGQNQISSKIKEEHLELQEAYKHLMQALPSKSRNNHPSRKAAAPQTASLEERENFEEKKNTVLQNSKNNGGQKSNEKSSPPNIQVLRAHFTHEVCDLIFHIMVACQHAGVEVDALARELERREAQSGIEEKRLRKKPF